MNDYIIRGLIEGRVLGKQFTKDFYSLEDATLEEIIYEAVYLYAEGNYSCDCNKLSFIGADNEFYCCGDEYKYEELFLITQEGGKIDLLKESWFLDDH